MGRARVSAPIVSACSHRPSRCSIASRTSRNLEAKPLAQYVYFFGGGKADGNKDMKDTLGGKGAGLAEMTNAGLPVPPGFTISTAACNLFQEHGSLTAEIEGEIDLALSRLQGLMAKTLGAAADPLLVSVRSGAKFSMPGMMDTILNLGLNDESVQGLKAQTRNG